MVITLWKKISPWIGKFLYLQLFLSLVAFPIVVCWGLPVSILSPVGNLIFGPALTIFLLLSSMFFFSELLCIPNSFLAYALDAFTQLWLKIIKISPYPWTIGIAKPSVGVLLCIPVCALIIVHYSQWRSVWQPIACFAILLIGSGFYIHVIHTKHSSYNTFACNKGQVSFVRDSNRLMLIDPGFMGQRISAPSWVEFSLVPHVISTYGTTCIDTVVLLQPGAMVFQAMTTLLTKCRVKKIYLVCWSGLLPKYAWRSFFAMKEAAKLQGTLIERIAKTPICVPLDHGICTIKPLKSFIKANDMTYPAVVVQGLIDNVSFNIASAKYSV
jgi:hypothetical protein